MDFSNLLTPLAILQVITAILFLISLIFGIKIASQYTEARPFITILTTYILHVIVFYSFVLTTTFLGTRAMYSDIINGWSSGIRLHLALITSVTFTVLLFGRGKKWIRPK
jgi:hypothetical protein